MNKDKSKPTNPQAPYGSPNTTSATSGSNKRPDTQKQGGWGSSQPNLSNKTGGSFTPNTNAGLRKDKEDNRGGRTGL